MVRTKSAVASTRGRCASLVFCAVLSIVLPAAAIGQDCDSSLRPVSDAALAYRDRGNRCEGFYVSQTSTGRIDVIGVMRGKLAYELRADEMVRVTVPDSAPSAVTVRAQGVALKTYYRMDARVSPGETLEWPVGDVLFDGGLSSDRVGVSAFYHEGDARVFVPVSAESTYSPVRNDSIVRVILRPTVDVNNVQYRWIDPISHDATPWQRELITTARAGRRYVIRLPDLPAGRVRVVASAQVEGEDDAWIDSSLIVHTR